MAQTVRSRINAVRPVGHLMVALFLYYAGALITLPFLVDIFLEALCPGELQCSKVIVMMGALQLTSGLGSVVVAPALGSLSDEYGRKPLFVVLIFASSGTSVLLALNRSTTGVYIWFVVVSIVLILKEAGLLATALAYVADVVVESERSSAVGLTIAALSFGLLAGTVGALLSTTATQACWTAAILQICATLYLALFVKESNPRGLPFPVEQSQSESLAKLLPKSVLLRQNTKLRETGMIIWSSSQLRTVALVDFMNSFGMTGLQSFILYFLKSVFNFGKNEFSYIVVSASIGAALGQMLLYPILTHFIGERGVLWIGLAFTGGNYFLYGLAWAPWVPYVAAGMALFYSFVSPALGSIASRGVDKYQQGKVQGYMGGVRSAAVIAAPLVLTPLTANALGDNPPFNFRGLPFMVCGASMVVAFFISLSLPPLPPPEHPATDYIQAPLPPEAVVHFTAPPADLLHVPIHNEVPG